VDIPDSDRRGVYNHLASHYRDFDREPPEFRSEQRESEPEESKHIIRRHPTLQPVVRRRLFAAYHNPPEPPDIRELIREEILRQKGRL